MKMKPTFLHHAQPLLCCMIQTHEAKDALAVIRNACFDGADAFGLQCCQLQKDDRDEKTIRSLFRAMEDKPVYVTNYRVGLNKDKDDDELGKELVQLAEWGATLCDVMGDMYHPEAIGQTEDGEAVRKQKELIRRIHEAGGEVLLSAHTGKFMSEEEVLKLAFQQEERGADIVKIVTMANSEAEQMENLRITSVLQEKLETPFLFLSGGSQCKLHRMIGPMLGSTMYLCVQQHDRMSTGAQPVLRAVRTILDHFDYKPELER